MLEGWKRVVKGGRGDAVGGGSVLEEYEVVGDETGDELGDEEEDGYEDVTYHAVLFL